MPRRILRLALASLALSPALAAGCTCSQAPADDALPPPSAVVVVASPSAAPKGPPPAHAAPLPPSAAAPTPAPGTTEPTVLPSGTTQAGPSASPSASPSGPAPSGSGEPAGDRPLHVETQEGLLSLFSIRQFSEKEIKRRGDPQIFLTKNVGPDGPSKGNQGNRAIAHHAISREQCLAGLAGVTLQTEEQKQRCGGAENMVPVYRKGDPSKAKVCIDVFEFPNKPCELPFVWVSPLQAQVLCEMQGKRLCQQEEWTLACRGDPEGKEDWNYAYGNDLDLEVCNTNKPHKSQTGAVCEPDSAGSAWRTCETNTEPAGSFPRCKSRFGVFDLHGNVAEAMTRLDPDGHTYSQLKGSAFFYVDVARKHNERPPKDSGHETYPDHCAYDPRWHVEPMETAWHVNYHLGFRCCKSIKLWPRALDSRPGSSRRHGVRRAFRQRASRAAWSYAERPGPL